MRKQIYIAIGIVIVVIVALYFFLGSDTKTSETIEVKASFGEFKIAVTTTGELEAKSSEKIYGPDNLRNVRIWNVKIEDMVPDGTVVDSGDFVAAFTDGGLKFDGLDFGKRFGAVFHHTQRGVPASV